MQAQNPRPTFLRESAPTDVTESEPWLSLGAHHAELPKEHPALSFAVNNALALFGCPLTVVGDGGQTVAIASEALLQPNAIHALSRKSLSIACGKSSGNLCAVRVANEEFLQAFLLLNPVLQKSLITRNGTVFTIWMRIAGPYIECDLQLKLSRWCASSLVDLYRQSGADCRFLGTSVAVVEFGAINWLPEDRAELDHRLRVDRAGAPFLGSKLNLQYWALAFVEDCHIVYCRSLRMFCSARAGKVTYLTANQATQEMDSFLRQSASAFREPRLLALLQPRLLKQFIQTVQGVGGCDSTGLDVVLADFIKKRLSPKAGCAVTVREIWSRFESLHFSNFPALRASGLASSVPQLILATFGIPRSNSIVREGRAQTGFRGLGWSDELNPGGAA